jgi:hypothetical protein
MSTHYISRFFDKMGLQLGSTNRLEGMRKGETIFQSPHRSRRGNGGKGAAREERADTDSNGGHSLRPEKCRPGFLLRSF